MFPPQSEVCVTFSTTTWFGWFFILNTVRATLHLPFIQIFQNVMLKNQTNKLHVLHKPKHTFMLHTSLFLYSSIQPFKKNIKNKNKKKVSVWKVLENFLMSFHFVSVFLSAWVKGVCIFGSSFFSFISLIKKNGQLHSLRGKQYDNDGFFYFIFWNFSQAKIFWSRFEKVSKSIRLSPITRLFTVLIPQYYST